MKPLFYSLCILFSFIGCKHEKNKKNTPGLTVVSAIKYAKGFDIVTKKGRKYIILKKVFQSSEKQFEYLLSDKNNSLQHELKVPVEKLVVTSTTHIPMLELLGGEHTLVGFPNTKYVSSKKTRKLIDNGIIVELGSEHDMNTEILIDLQPDLIVGFSLHPNNKLYNNIKKTGIPVIFNGEWLEETPLGRAEWIKFFGALLKKEKESDSIFREIERNYLMAKNIAKIAGISPRILSGSFFQDVWYVPAGESFMAKFLADANLNYLWRDTKGTGSLQLSFESVLDKAHNADYWIGCGLYESKDQLLSASKHYNKFSSLHNGKIYTIASKKGVTGGIKYFEFAPIRPDLVLKDLIKITNPELLKEYEFTFFDEID